MPLLHGSSKAPLGVYIFSCKLILVIKLGIALKFAKLSTPLNIMLS